MVTIESSEDGQNDVEDVLSEASDAESSSSSGLDSEGADEFEPAWEDVLGTGVVLKRTIRQAPRDKRKIHPEYNQQVLLHAVGKVAATGDVFMDTYKDGKPLEFEIGDMILEIVDHGVMLVTRLMCEGEIACAKVVSRYAFGPKGLPPVVPPDADVEYRLELVRIKDYTKEPAELTDQELIDVVRLHKERGNFFFGQEEWEKAMRCYQRAMKYSERSSLQGGPAPTQAANGEAGEEDLEVVGAAYVKDLNELRVSCINNSATALEKLERHKEALDACVALLEFDPKHLKSLLRVARISTIQGNYKEASLALARAAEYYPKNAAVRKHIQTLKEHRAKYLEKKRSAFSGTLNKGKATKKEGSDEDANSGKSKEESKDTEDKPGSPKRNDSLSEKRSSSRKWISRCMSLLVLLAPTLAFLVAMARAPAVAEGLELSEAPWRDVKLDLAQKELDVLTSADLDYSTLLCDGKRRRSSCCVCKTTVAQIEMRTQATGRAATKPLSYHYIATQENQGTGSFFKNEDALINELNRACQRVPLDIPKAETRIELVKRYTKRSCEILVENFYDDIFYTALRSSRSVVDQICTQVIGVCEPETPWNERLMELSDPSIGLDYSSLFCGDSFKEDSACCLCKSVMRSINTAVERGTAVEDFVRNPTAVCSNVTMAIPKAETRLQLVKKSVGSACLQYMYRYTNEIKSRAKVPRKATLKHILTGLCRDTANCQCTGNAFTEK